MEEKVYYEETLSTGEIVTVTDSYVRCRKPYRRKNKEGYKMDKIIPLSSVSKVLRKPDLGFVIKNIFIYSMGFTLAFGFGYSAGYYLAGGFSDGVNVLKLISIFSICFVIVSCLLALLSFVVEGIYVAGDKACFYVIANEDEYKKFVEAMDSANKEGENQ